jgi:hypothetical protein
MRSRKVLQRNLCYPRDSQISELAKKVGVWSIVAPGPICFVRIENFIDHVVKCSAERLGQAAHPEIGEKSPPPMRRRKKGPGHAQPVAPIKAGTSLVSPTNSTTMAADPTNL